MDVVIVVVECEDILPVKDVSQCEMLTCSSSHDLVVAPAATQAALFWLIPAISFANFDKPSFRFKP